MAETEFDIIVQTEAIVQAEEFTHLMDLAREFEWLDLELRLGVGGKGDVSKWRAARTAYLQELARLNPPSDP